MSFSSLPPNNQKILVLDDDAAVVDYLCESLSAEGYDPVGITSARSAIERIQKETFDLVISDVEMPELRGLDLLRSILKHKPAQLVLLITAFGSVELAVESVRAGACDFLTKPFKIEVLLHAVERALSERKLQLEVVRLRAALKGTPEPGEFVAGGPAMLRVVDLARKIAGTSAPALITGETGTGKTMLARFIHESGARRKQPFVQLNCAAIPGSLAESELFGVRRGAFTDAREDRKGLFVAAGGGTIFLDEIGELPVSVQATLLHTLESGTVRRLGGTTEEAVKARLIAATNQPLEVLLREGKFRADLYYRINVIRIDLPPLRERKEDIIPLVESMVSAAALRHDRAFLKISSSAMKLLASYPWPGNIRELANAIERAVATAEHDLLKPEDFELEPVPWSRPDQSANSPGTLDAVERAHVLRVLESVNGNKAAAARQLGITRRTLYRKLGV